MAGPSLSLCCCKTIVNIPSYILPSSLSERRTHTLYHTHTHRLSCSLRTPHYFRLSSLLQRVSIGGLSAETVGAWGQVQGGLVGVREV